MKKKSIIWNFTKEQLENWAIISNSFTELLGFAGLKNRGNNFKTLRKVLDFYKIDYSEIKKRSHKNQSNNLKFYNIIPLENVLVENSTYRNSSLKKRLIEASILENKCYQCELLPEWKGKYLSLQIDHINGNSQDNRIENLRLLCPNCHSQTDNFAGKSKKLPKKKCLDCNKNITTDNGYCRKCKNSKPKFNSRKVKNRPSKIELEQLLNCNSWTYLGKMYGVSDNAVRKWAKQYNIL